jgi:hypothetical protein
LNCAVIGDCDPLDSRFLSTLGAWHTGSFFETARTKTPTGRGSVCRDFVLMRRETLQTDHT